MARSLKFSIRNILLVTCAAALFLANLVPYDVGHPSGPRIESRGFPFSWTIYAVPLRASAWTVALRKWHIILFNGVSCVGLVVGASAIVRRMPKWVRMSKAPASNPAQILLIAFGAGAMSLSIVSMPTRSMGQFASCAAIFVFGAFGLYLAYRSYDSLNRWWTMAWGVLTTLILLYIITFIDPISSGDGRSIVGAGTTLMSLVAVALLALQKRPVATTGKR